jgi:hypothetical protein
MNCFVVCFFFYFAGGESAGGESLLRNEQGDYIVYTQPVLQKKEEIEAASFIQALVRSYVHVRIPNFSFQSHNQKQKQAHNHLLTSFFSLLFFFFFFFAAQVGGTGPAGNRDRCEGADDPRGSHDGQRDAAREPPPARIQHVRTILWPRYLQQPRRQPGLFDPFAAEIPAEHPARGGPASAV